MIRQLRAGCRAGRLGAGTVLGRGAIETPAGRPGLAAHAAAGGRRLLERFRAGQRPGRHGGRGAGHHLRRRGRRPVDHRRQRPARCPAGRCRGWRRDGRGRLRQSGAGGAGRRPGCPQFRRGRPDGRHPRRPQRRRRVVRRRSLRHRPGHAGAVVGRRGAARRRDRRPAGHAPARRRLRLQWGPDARYGRQQHHRRGGPGADGGRRGRRRGTLPRVLPLHAERRWRLDLPEAVRLRRGNGCQLDGVGDAGPCCGRRGSGGVERPCLGAALAAAAFRRVRLQR